MRYDNHVNHHDALISLTSTSLALSFPSLVGFFEKWMFAMFTAVSTAFVSHFIGMYLQRRNGGKE